MKKITLRHMPLVSGIMVMVMITAAFGQEVPVSKSQESTVAQESVAQESVTQESVTQESVAQESVAQESVTQESVTQESVTQESVTQESVTQESVTQESDAAGSSLYGGGDAYKRSKMGRGVSSSTQSTGSNRKLMALPDSLDSSNQSGSEKSDSVSIAAVASDTDKTTESGNPLPLHAEHEQEKRHISKSEKIWVTVGSAVIAGGLLAVILAKTLGKESGGSTLPGIPNPPSPPDI